MITEQHAFLAAASAVTAVGLFIVGIIVYEACKWLLKTWMAIKNMEGEMNEILIDDRCFCKECAYFEPCPSEECLRDDDVYNCALHNEHTLPGGRCHDFDKEG